MNSMIKVIMLVIVVINMQMLWKTQLRRNEMRKKIIRDKWNKEVKELLKDYKLYPRRNSTIIWRLENISERRIIYTINKYFLYAKKKYLTSIKEWIKKSKAERMETKLLVPTNFTLITLQPMPEELIDSGKQERAKKAIGLPSFQANRRKSKFKKGNKAIRRMSKITDTIKKEETITEHVELPLVPPAFYYIPSKEKLIEMILDRKSVV